LELYLTEKSISEQLAQEVLSGHCAFSVVSFSRRCYTIAIAVVALWAGNNVLYDKIVGVKLLESVEATITLAFEQ